MMPVSGANKISSRMGHPCFRGKVAAYSDNATAGGRFLGTGARANILFAWAATEPAQMRVNLQPGAGGA
jgi:hypothetical protein